jgi:hypothetical protein
MGRERHKIFPVSLNQSFPSSHLNMAKVQPYIQVPGVSDSYIIYETE